MVKPLTLQLDLKVRDTKLKFIELLSICSWFFNVRVWNSFWKLKLKVIFVFHLSDYSSLLEVKELKKRVAVRHPGLSCSKLGWEPRVSVRFEFIYESLKGISVLILFVYKLMIGSSKTNRQNYPRKGFWTQDEETRVKFNPGISANRPSNNWALNYLYTVSYVNNILGGWGGEGSFHPSNTLDRILAACPKTLRIL